MKAQLVYFFALPFVSSSLAQPEGQDFENLIRVWPPIAGRMITPGSEYLTLADGAGKQLVPFHLRITSKPSHPHLAPNAPKVDGYAVHAFEGPGTLIFISSDGKPTGENGHFTFSTTSPASEGAVSGFLSTTFRVPGRHKNWTSTLPYMEIEESHGSKSVKLGVFERTMDREHTPARLVMDRDGRLVHPDRKVQWLACHTALSREASPVDLVHVSTGYGEPKSVYCKSYTPVEMIKEAIAHKD